MNVRLSSMSAVVLGWVAFGGWPPTFFRPNSPAPPEPAPPAAVAVGDATTADELLERLATADRDLRTLSANLRYVTVSTLDGDSQTRIGRVFFDSQPADAQGVRAKSINVTFDTVQRDGKSSAEGRSFILNQGVFVEKSTKDKQINRYKLGSKGKTIDPLKIGEGPFPLPFGQKPEDIKARFEVEFLPGTDGMTFKDEGVRRFYEGAYQLRLVPKAGQKAANEFVEARIWFEKKDLIPIQARTTKPEGAGSDEFFLWDILLNEPVEATLFDTATPTGWQEEQKDLE